MEVTFESNSFMYASSQKSQRVKTRGLRPLFPKILFQLDRLLLPQKGVKMSIEGLRMSPIEEMTRPFNRHEFSIPVARELMSNIVEGGSCSCDNQRRS